MIKQPTPSTSDPSSEKVGDRYPLEETHKLSETVSAEVAEQLKQVRNHFEHVRKELENGVRPKRGRFRL